MSRWLTKLFSSSRQDAPSAAASAARSQAETCKNDGNTHLAAGELDAAADCYRQAIALDPHYADAFNNLGFVLHQLGRTSEALQSLRQALHLNPKLANAHFNLGTLAEQIGDVDQAVCSYQSLVSLQPDHAAAFNRLGVLLANQRKLEQARTCFDKAISLHPEFAEARYNLGNLLFECGRPNEALPHLQQAIDLVPGFTQAHYCLGNALLETGRQDDALACYQQAIALDGEHAGAHNNAGTLLLKQGRIDEAVIFLRRAIALNPQSPQFHNNLGLALYDQGKLNEAIDSYRTAISLKPDFVEPHSNLGFALQKQGRLDEAMQYLQQAIMINPDHANAYASLGLVLQDRGRLDEAIANYRKSISLKPADNFNPRFCLAHALLSSGRLVDGWKHYEYRYDVTEDAAVRRNFPHPSWEGEALDGKALLIWGEQGVGDEILQASLFQEMIRRAGRCVIECTPKLVPLFARSFPTAQVVLRSDPPHPATLDAIDVQCAAGSLARWLRPSVASFPSHHGYLSPDPDRVAFWRSRLDALGPGLKVGFAWRSTNLSGVRHLYCTTLDQWGPIFAVPGVHFINLQYDECAGELAEASQRFGVPLHAVNEVDLFNDLAEAAAVTQALDLVLSAPTASSFLAAALGVPTWITYYGIPWQTLGTDHVPWFPAMRLFSRRWDQDWTPIIETVAEELLAHRARST